MNNMIHYAMLTALLTLQISTAPSSSAEANKPVVTGAAQTKNNIVITTDESITVEIIEAPLYEALKAITKKSSIKFEVTQRLMKEKISIKARGTDWAGVLKNLLRNYNYATSWRDNKLIKVFIFEHGTGRSMQLIPPNDAAFPPELQDIPPEILQGEEPEQGELLVEENLAAGGMEAELSSLPMPDDEDKKMIEITEDMIEPLLFDDFTPEDERQDQIRGSNDNESSPADITPSDLDAIPESILDELEMEPPQ